MYGIDVVEAAIIAVLATAVLPYCKQQIMFFFHRAQQILPLSIMKRNALGNVGTARNVWLRRNNIDAVKQKLINKLDSHCNQQTRRRIFNLQYINPHNIESTHLYTETVIK